MDDQQYTASQLASDAHFIKWVNQPDSSSNHFWQEWLGKHPDKKAIVEEARELVQLIHFQEVADSQQRLDAVWQRILASNEALHTKASNGRQISLWTNWQKLAAIFIGILLTFAAIYYMLLPAPAFEYATKPGEIKQIQLPDGSQLVLNANSHLRYACQDEHHREVWLEGEAYFSVRKKPLAEDRETLSSFTVHTAQVAIKVLGTEFNVYERNNKSEVVLNSGRIALEVASIQQSLEMKPGELVAFSPSSPGLIHKRVDASIYNSWTRKEWILDNMSLGQIATKMEETFAVKVLIKNPALASTVVSGVVPIDNLSVLLKALASSTQTKISYEHNQVIIQ